MDSSFRFLRKGCFRCLGNGFFRCLRSGFFRTPGNRFLRTRRDFSRHCRTGQGRRQNLNSGIGKMHRGTGLLLLHRNGLGIADLNIHRRSRFDLFRTYVETDVKEPGKGDAQSLLVLRRGPLQERIHGLAVVGFIIFFRKDLPDCQTGIHGDLCFRGKGQGYGEILSGTAHFRGKAGKHLSVSQDPQILCLIGYIADPVLHIAFNGSDHGRGLFRFRNVRGNDARMVCKKQFFFQGQSLCGKSFQVPAEEDQIAGLGCIGFGKLEQGLLTQLGDPVRGRILPGVIPDTGIVHAEPDKQRIPVCIGQLIPGTVSAVALQILIFQGAVALALPVVQLTLGNSHQILRPVSGHRHIPEHGVPDIHCFRICRQIQIRHNADSGMGVLRNGAQHLPGFIETFFGMGMLAVAAEIFQLRCHFIGVADVFVFVLFPDADQLADRLSGVSQTALTVDVLHRLRQLTDFGTLGVVAVFVVVMRTDLLFPAGQLSFAEAFCFMAMAAAFLNGTGHLTDLVAGICVGMGNILFPAAAGKLDFVAAVTVAVGLGLFQRTGHALHLIAALTVAVAFRFFQVAVQRNGLIAAFAVTVPLPFRSGADEIAVSIGAAFPMGVAFRLSLAADQILLGSAAGLAVDMAGDFLLGADQHLLNGNAGFRMDMAFRFRQGAGQHLFLPAAGGVVQMDLAFLQLTDQHRFLGAAVGMYMGLFFRKAAQNLRLTVAGIFVNMCGSVRQLAAQNPFPVIAISDVAVEHHGPRRFRKTAGKVVIGIAFITAILVGMGLQSAKILLFHGDGRQDQRISGTEHHHGRHGLDDLLQIPSALAFFIQFYCKSQQNPSHSVSSLLAELRNYSDGFKRPDPIDDSAYDGIGSDAAYAAVPGVYGSLPVVSHQEILSLGYLVRQCQITVAQGLFPDIGLIQNIAVHRNGAILGDVYPGTGTGNIAFHQKLVPVIEGDDIAGLILSALQRYHNLAFLQGRSHGSAVNLQHRQPQHSHQNSGCGSGDENENGASQSLVIFGFILFPLQFLFQFFRSGGLDKFHAESPADQIC